MVTLDQAIDAAIQLPPEQQEMLMKILQKRQIEARRQEIADDARESLADFRKGKLKPQPVPEIIEKLRQAVEDEACAHWKHDIYILGVAWMPMPRNSISADYQVVDIVIV